MSANENTSPDAMLDSIAALIREFLVCDDHQLTVLTLWVLHTWCYTCLRSRQACCGRSPTGTFPPCGDGFPPFRPLLCPVS